MAETTLRLTEGGLELDLLPRCGGKIVRLRRRGGREWLYSQQRRVLPDASVFDADASFGWDELFPTVLTGSAAAAPWAHPLRDHGELWGRPWEVRELSRRHAHLAFDDQDGRFRFERSVKVLSGRRVELHYTLTNLTSLELPFLWSMHPVLAACEGDRILLPPVDTVVATFLRHPDLEDAAGLTWPTVRVRGRDVALDMVPGWDGATAAKLYAGPLARTVVGLQGDGEWLVLEADTNAPYVGLYLNYGGWPMEGSRLYQIGLEPTTSPVDDLGTAVAAGCAPTVPPSGRLEWRANVTVGWPDEPLPSHFEP